MVLHFDNRDTEKQCSQHCFTFCSSLQGLVFLSECKTIELRLLPAAKQKRKSHETAYECGVKSLPDHEYIILSFGWT